MTNNKGYTLVEALIVVAIMLILASLSMFSVGIIRDAKRSSAVSTFDSQISSCIVKTKAVSEVSGDSVVCMYIKKRVNGGKTNYCIKVGYNKSTVEDIVTGTAVSDTDDTTWDAVLPKDVATIKYNGADINTEQKIIFKKSDGSVSTGGGSYDFYKSNGEKYATIYLDSTTGKHYVE